MSSGSGSARPGPLPGDRAPAPGGRRKGEEVKPRDRATLKRESADLDKLFLRRDVVPEKVLVPAELGYMRQQLLADRRRVDVTDPVNPPYAFVHIAFDRDAGEFFYRVLEPTLKPGEREQMAQIREKMEVMMSQEELPISEGLNLELSPALREYLRNRFLTVLDLYDIDVAEKRRPAMPYYLKREFVGLGRTDAVLRDPFLEDVSCLGPRMPLYVFHRVFGSLRTNGEYDGELELNKYILRLAQISGKHISIYPPILDATLRDGSRINLTLRTEVTRKGSTFSIRKFAQDPVSPIDLLRFGSLSPHELAYFWTLVEAHRSLLISGGTTSGKTTLLNAISMFIRPADKIVSIEDTPEIHIDHQNWITSVARSDASGTTQTFESRILGATTATAFAASTAGLGFSGCGSNNLIADCGYAATWTGNGNPGVITSVGGSADAIGYASDGLARATGSGVSILSFNGAGQVACATAGQCANGAVTPTLSATGTISAGIQSSTTVANYLGWRPFEWVTTNTPTGEVQVLLTYVLDPANNIAFAAESQTISIYRV